jgi:poly(A) polymerase
LAGRDLAKQAREIFNKTLIDAPAQKVLAHIAVFLKSHNMRGYLVGGFVRDALLGRETADIDIAIEADALEIGPQLADSLQGKFVLLDEVNRIGRIIIPDWTIDVASFTGKIEEDLKRRDFTINAMAVDLQQLISENQNAVLVDPFGGRLDLDRGIIKMVTATVFQDDPVRLLRAVRLAAELDFAIDRQAEVEMEQAAPLIATVPGERVREELLRLLNASHGGQVFADMEKLGLLTALIPELQTLKGVEQPKEHHWDVFEHSLKSVSAADFILHQGAWEYQNPAVLNMVPWNETIAEYFDRPVSSGSTGRSLLKLAALLHDIGKPQTKALDENGRVRFLGHAETGAEAVESILERLRFSTKEARLVTLMVKYHMRPTQLSQDEMPTTRAIYRYFRDTGDAGIDTLYLSLADHLAARGPGLLPDQWEYHTSLVAYVLKEHFQQKAAGPVKLIDGNDLINVFGMKPGAEMGALLEEIKEAQAAGEVTDREAALEYVRKHLSAL